jgi:hypothetical protein
MRFDLNYLSLTLFTSHVPLHLLPFLFAKDDDDDNDEDAMENSNNAALVNANDDFKPDAEASEEEEDEMAIGDSDADDDDGDGIAQEYRKVNQPGKQPEAGIIAKVYCENFMCHRK